MKARHIKQRADAHTALVRQRQLANTIDLLERKARALEWMRKLSIQPVEGAK